MNKQGFAEDVDFPPVPFQRARVAVADALKTRGWFLKPARLVSPLLAEEVCERVARYLYEWAQRSGMSDAGWDAVSVALSIQGESVRFFLDPRPDLRELFCRLAGIGECGRSFELAAQEVGLAIHDREDAALRDLACWMRSVDREHLQELDSPAFAGLLFERIESWPFAVGLSVVDVENPTCRQDVVRYAELTSLDISKTCRHWKDGEEDASPSAPRHPGTWLRVFGLAGAMERFYGLRDASSTSWTRETVHGQADQMRTGLRYWLRRERLMLEDFSVAGFDFRELAAKVFGSLMEHSFDPCECEPVNRLNRFSANSAASLRMWFARASYEGRYACMPGPVAEKWLRLLKSELACLRPLFGQDDVVPEGANDRARTVWNALRSGDVIEPEGAVMAWHRCAAASASLDASLLKPSELFDRDKDYFLACADQVFQLEGLWEGMRQLLLAMRALKSPCVASDLRYWEEAGADASHYPRQPEEPWRCIPAKLVESFHAFVSKEEAKDPELKGLRSEFASFCLNGLRDTWSEKERKAAEASGRLRTNEDMVETSPDWRYCRIRAAKTLAINPDGRGHRLLETASRIDPDPDVREVANDAYQSLRRGVTLPEGVSPRRAVLGAFWWLRQAHLKALNIEIDRDGAQRTRIKELSRTKERRTN